MTTWIIVGVLAAYIVYACIKSKNRIKNGCCGGGSQRVEIEVDESAYQHHSRYHIKGMHCENCASKIETALNKSTDMAAVINLKKNTLDIYTNHDFDERELIRTVERLGYELHA